MTSAELAARRFDPLHVQTMRRRSLVTRGTWVYSDVEELSAEALALAVSRFGPEWSSAGPPFIRQRPPTDKDTTP